MECKVIIRYTNSVNNFSTHMLTLTLLSSVGMENLQGSLKLIYATSFNIAFLFVDPNRYAIIRCP